MPQRPTSILTTLAVSLLALTLIAPWALGQDPDPITEIRRLAEQGDVDAQFNLGVMYATGEGVPENDAEAVRWYRLAADQGYTNAQLSLGLMYANGEGVARDLAEAVKWYRLAAEQGDAMGQYALGFMYDYGEGLPDDYVLAYAWYNLAAAQGNKVARKNKDNLRTRMTPDQIARAQELSATLFDRIN